MQNGMHARAVPAGRTHTPLPGYRYPLSTSTSTVQLYRDAFVTPAITTVPVGYVKVQIIEINGLPSPATALDPYATTT